MYAMFKQLRLLYARVESRSLYVCLQVCKSDKPCAGDVVICLHDDVLLCGLQKSCRVYVKVDRKFALSSVSLFFIISDFSKPCLISSQIHRFQCQVQCRNSLSYIEVGDFPNYSDFQHWLLCTNSVSILRQVHVLYMQFV